MAPALSHGQIVLAVRRRARLGDIVVLRHGGLDKIKRVAKVRPGEVFVLGDNSAQSTDSSEFGWLPETTLQAVVLWAI